MAQRDYKRLSRRGRHLIHRLRRTKHASVQHVMVGELVNEIHRSRWKRAAPSTPPGRPQAGHWRPLNRRAKSLLTQLRRTKVWAVQRRLVKELVVEMGKGRKRVADRVKGLKPTRRRRRRSSSPWSGSAPGWTPARPAPSAPARTPRPAARASGQTRTPRSGTRAPGVVHKPISNGEHWLSRTPEMLAEIRRDPAAGWDDPLPGPAPAARPRRTPPART